MPAPTITTIRSGVQFTPNAAASFRRAEAALGRRIDVNSTYRDWNVQWSMYVAWNAYFAGRGPYPGHSRAIHPDLSVHCKGLALDSDDWTKPGFIALMAEHGWIRTAAYDPTERHHFEYQSWRDQHIGEVAGGSFIPIIIPDPDYEQDDTMILINIGDGDGRYGPKNAQYYALVTGDGRKIPVSITFASKLRYAHGERDKDGKPTGSAYVVAYADWEAFDVAPVVAAGFPTKIIGTLS